MKYEAVFGIDHGVSMGFGFKYPDYTEKTKTIDASDPEAAMYLAVEVATKFCEDYLSNPETGEVRVCIKKILDSDGKLLDQKALVIEKYKHAVDENGIFHGYLDTNTKLLKEGLIMIREQK